MERSRDGVHPFGKENVLVGGEAGSGILFGVGFHRWAERIKGRGGLKKRWRSTGRPRPGKRTAAGCRDVAGSGDKGFGND